MKKAIVLLIAVIMILSLVGCSADTASKEATKLLSSEDFPFERVMLKISDTAYSTKVISWEYVSEDMIMVLAERRVGSGDNTKVYNQAYLVHETNVIFSTEKLVEEVEKQAVSMKRKKILKAKKDFKRDLREAMKDVRNGKVYPMEDIDKWMDELMNKKTTQINF